MPQNTYSKLFLVVGAIVLFLNSTAAAQNNDIASTIDRYLGARTEMGGFSGAILVVKDGSVMI
ncbi:MAG: hypothetical protein ACREO5_14475, partial [Candidatus Binatia bacterium]